MDRKVFVAIALAVILVAVIFLAFALFKPFLLSILWAGALAIVSYRPYRALCALLKGRDTIAAALMTVCVIVLILGPFCALAVYFFEDAVGLTEDLKPANLKVSLKPYLDVPVVRKTITWMQDEPDVEDALKSISKTAISWLGGFAGSALGFLMNLAAGLAFVTLSLYFFYKDGPALVVALRELVPMSEDDRDTIFGDIAGAVIAAVRGGLMVALVQGALGYVILFILNVDNPVLWSAVMALCSLIPLVGTALVWAPIAGMFAIEGDIMRAVVLVGYGVVIIAMADNLLRPMLVGKHMEANPLLLFFGTLGGITLFGFSGIILGPVSVALLNVTVRLFRREFRGQPEHPDAEPAATP
jgi:predicted PurR-regulated permease PerM